MKRKMKRKTILLILLSVCLLQGELRTLHADSEDCNVPSVLGFETGLTIPEVQKQIKEHHPYAEMELKSPTNLAMGSGLGTTTEFFFDETGHLYRIEHIVFSLILNEESILEHLKERYGEPTSREFGRPIWTLCSGRYTVQARMGVEILDTELQKVYHKQVADSIIGVE